MESTCCGSAVETEGWIQLLSLTTCSCLAQLYEECVQVNCGPEMQEKKVSKKALKESQHIRKKSTERKVNEGP